MQLEIAALHAARAPQAESELALASAQRPAAGSVVEHRLQLVNGLEVQAEPVVVAVAHEPLLVDHDHRALGAEAEE